MSADRAAPTAPSRPARARLSAGSAALRQLVASERFQLAALLALALLVRLALHFRSPAFVGKDSQSYFLPGWEIARGEPFEIGQRRTPGYPLFISAVILFLGEELRSLALAQHLLGVGTVGVTYLLGRLSFGRAAGLLAGLLVAVDGPLLIYERYVMAEALLAFTLSLALLAAMLAVRRPTWQRWLLTGLALGAAVLTKPSAQTIAPLLALAALLAARGRWRTAARNIAALALGLALLQLPWMARNYVVNGSFNLSTFGRTLIARTAYYDRGFTFNQPDQPHPDPLMQRAREIIQEGAERRESDGTIAGRLRQELDLNPVQVNRVMRDIAVEAILRNPRHYLEGTLAFAAEIFAGVEERLRDHWEEYKDVNPWDPRIQHLVGGPTPAELAERPNANRIVNIYQPARFATPLALLTIIGLGVALLVPRCRLALLPGLAAPLLILASAALDGPVERYRYPLDPAIAVLVGGALAGAGLLVERLRARRSLPSAGVDRHPVAASSLDG